MTHAGFGNLHCPLQRDDACRIGMTMRVIALQLITIVFVAAYATGASAQQLGKMPFAVDCILLQNNSAALWSKGLPPDAAASVAKAAEEEMKTYRNGQVRQDPAVLRAEIQRLLAESERTDLPNQSRDFYQRALASVDASLCWQDFAARRDHTFPTTERLQFLADLRGKAARELAEAVRREASKPDDAKVVGRGSRGD
jgi:hypothetical protein